MSHDEFPPGETAPASGLYLELNVVGSPTGTAIVVRERETFPASPRGFTWKALAAYPAFELRHRAGYYRQMAGTASTAEVRDSLLKLAQRFDMLADDREAIT